MSGFLAAFAFLATVSPARAAEPAGVVPVAPRAPDDLDVRHRLGLQLGGSSFVQASYRARTVGHVYVDVGLGGAPHGVMNGSAGLVVAYSTGTRLFPYAAGGVGFGLLAGRPDAANDSSGKCDYGGPGCPSESVGVAYGYGRAGVGVMLGEDRRFSLLLDFGAWVGTKWRSRVDAMGTRTETSERFVWPVPGLAGFVSF